MREYQAKMLTEDATCEDGVLRWKSNGQVPFDDMLQLAQEIGLPVDLDASRAARQTEQAAFLAEYRRAQRSPSAEEVAEMRAAFGEGTTVVDVLSGRRIRL